MLNKGPRWDLRSSWTVIPLIPQRVTSKSRAIFLFEHVVTVTGVNSNVEVVARFVHSLPRRAQPRAGGLVSLVIRSRNNRHRSVGLNRHELRKPGKLKFKAFHVSPQSRGASGNSSPVSAPLALSSNPGVVGTIGSAPETIKEDIGTSVVAPAPALSSPAAVLPDQTCPDIHQVSPVHAELPADATSVQTQAWLRARRFHAFESTFSSFSASDILRLTRDDLIQICGLADGIRLYNALHARAPQPKLSLYFAVESPNSGVGGLWRAVYLESLTSGSLTSKLLGVTGLGQERLHSVLLLGPQGIHVLVTNELVANMRDESMFVVESIKEPGTDRYKLLLKPSSH